MSFNSAQSCELSFAVDFAPVIGNREVAGAGQASREA
jgi:hypothetical protein